MIVECCAVLLCYNANGKTNLLEAERWKGRYAGSGQWDDQGTGAFGAFYGVLCRQDYLLALTPSAGWYVKKQPRLPANR